MPVGGLSLGRAPKECRDHAREIDGPNTGVRIGPAPLRTDGTFDTRPPALRNDPATWPRRSARLAASRRRDDRTHPDRLRRVRERRLDWLTHPIRRSTSVRTNSLSGGAPFARPGPRRVYNRTGPTRRPSVLAESARKAPPPGGPFGGTHCAPGGRHTPHPRRTHLDDLRFYHIRAGQRMWTRARIASRSTQPRRTNGRRKHPPRARARLGP